MSCAPSCAELAAIQADVAALVCGTCCTIKRGTLTNDAYGSQAIAALPTVATVKVGTSSASRARAQASEQLREYSHQIGALQLWTVHFPLGTDVLSGDYLIIANDTLVVQSLSPGSSISALKTVLAVIVK